MNYKNSASHGMKKIFWSRAVPDSTAVIPDAANLSARSLVFFGSQPAWTEKFSQILGHFI